MNCLPRTDFIQNYITANLFGVRENAHQIFALGRRVNMEYGLVLAGGGVRGAYQIGVWKALKELKIKVSAVSGVSIGAVNGALFVQGSKTKAERIMEQNCD